jgi:hypothetical protein
MVHQGYGRIGTSNPEVVLSKQMQEWIVALSNFSHPGRAARRNQHHETAASNE